MRAVRGRGPPGVVQDLASILGGSQCNPGLRWRRGDASLLSQQAEDRLVVAVGDEVRKVVAAHLVGLIAENPRILGHREHVVEELPGPLGSPQQEMGGEALGRDPENRRAIVKCCV